MKYSFDRTAVKDGFKVELDTCADYGCWEWPDGSEGGGLWLSGGELEDYDGVFELPRPVVGALRDLGVAVSDDV